MASSNHRKSKSWHSTYRRDPLPGQTTVITCTVVRSRRFASNTATPLLAFGVGLVHSGHWDFGRMAHQKISVKWNWREMSTWKQWKLGLGRQCNLYNSIRIWTHLVPLATQTRGNGGPCLPIVDISIIFLAIYFGMKSQRWTKHFHLLSTASVAINTSRRQQNVHYSQVEIFKLVICCCFLLKSLYFSSKYCRNCPPWIQLKIRGQYY